MVFAGTGVWKSKRGTPLLTCRRVFINDEHYGYNVRDELIAADEVSYAHDDIGLYAPTSVSEVGKRTTAEGKTYTANNLNQYTTIDDFVPEYDADGNQTLIKTSTGIWSVVYNAENRPIRWQSGDTVITMSFDRMGRRIEMRTMKDGAETLQRFVYDNYLCIQQLRTPSNTLFHSYVWDPTEPIATRPLVFIPSEGEIAYYFHDGNKNVSDLVSSSREVIHYTYTFWGKDNVARLSTDKTSISTVEDENPFRFLSIWKDEEVALLENRGIFYDSDLGRRINGQNEEVIYALISPFWNRQIKEAEAVLGIPTLEITMDKKMKSGKNTIVCDGNGNLTIYLRGEKMKYEGDECTKRHEQQHITDTYREYGRDCCNGKPFGFSITDDLHPKGEKMGKWQRWKSECEAYKITISCLKEKREKVCCQLSGEEKRDCEGYLDLKISNALGQKRTYCMEKIDYEIKE